MAKLAKKKLKATNKKPKPTNKKRKPPNMKRYKVNHKKIAMNHSVTQVRSAIITRAVARALKANRASETFVTNTPKKPRRCNNNKEKVQKPQQQEKAKNFTKPANVGRPSVQTPSWGQMKQLFKETFNATQAVKNKAIKKEPLKKAKKPAYGRNGKTNQRIPDPFTIMESSFVCNEDNKYKRNQPKTQGKRKGVMKKKPVPVVKKRKKPIKGKEKQKIKAKKQIAKKPFKAAGTGNYGKKHMPKNALKKVGTATKALRQKKGVNTKKGVKKRPVPALKKNNKSIKVERGQKKKTKKQNMKKSITATRKKNHAKKKLSKNARKKVGNATKALRQKRVVNAKKGVKKRPVPALKKNNKSIKGKSGQKKKAKKQNMKKSITAARKENHAKKKLPKNARKKVCNATKALRQNKEEKKKKEKNKVKPVPALMMTCVRVTLPKKRKAIAYNISPVPRKRKRN